MAAHRWETSQDNTVPSHLDHLILGCTDLERAIALVADGTGVRAAFGGVHPGRGTQNALLSLGVGQYLEIVAPDPAQSELRQYSTIRDMVDPHLVGWAAGTQDIDALATQLRSAQIACDGPTDGSRSRPDGRTLRWKTLVLRDDEVGLLPFFIQWGAASIHPSVDAPPGCRLAMLSAATPDVRGLSSTAATLDLDIAITRGGRRQLLARIIGPHGDLELSS
jgi:hypothetical protein